ncbi:MAG: DUF4318 domain-containing protein [Lachnospiraceae bacterium]|nr:DUF4318 domain-containing protein [Lachnospiraceae bacterium]MDD3617498.1 DUF4318 domain-containing protein [Lachnospiraceae bacterium]
MKEVKWRIPTMTKPSNYYEICWNIAHFCIEQEDEYQFVTDDVPVRFYRNGVLCQAEVKSQRFGRSPVSWYICCKEIDDVSEALYETA